MTTTNNYQKIYDRLKKNLKKYEEKFTVLSNTNNNYSLEGTYSERFEKNLWFGGVEIRKNYVSYHLMPVYMYKELSQTVPESLKKRMQGKSCFNFNTYSEELFNEIEKFTDKCYKEFVKRGDNI